MGEIYEDQTRITYYDVDCEGRLKLTALLRMANIAAEQNANALGIGYFNLQPLSIAFVLQRFGLDIQMMPKYNQTVTIRTWPGEVARGMFNRYGEMISESGLKMMEWISQWVLFDLNERKILRPTALLTDLPTFGRLGVGILGKKIALPLDVADVSASSYTHTVRYCDLDTNGHMNNAVYGDLIINALYAGNAGTKKAQPIFIWSRLMINFITEALFNERILIKCNHTPGECIVSGAVENRTVFVASVSS